MYTEQVENHKFKLVLIDYVAVAVYYICSLAIELIIYQNTMFVCSRERDERTDGQTSDIRRCIVNGLLLKNNEKDKTIYFVAKGHVTKYICVSS
jgi:hypothetical protein